jgi:oligogalacturonide lyase
VIRLSDKPGSGSLYFNFNGYTPDGRLPGDQHARRDLGVDLKTHALRPLVDGKVRLLFVGRKTGQVYYQRMAEDGSGVVEAADPKTRKVRPIAKLARGVGIQTINADETLLAGVANRTDVPIPPNLMPTPCPAIPTT